MVEDGGNVRPSDTAVGCAIWKRVWAVLAHSGAQSASTARKLERAGGGREASLAKDRTHIDRYEVRDGWSWQSRTGRSQAWIARPGSNGERRPRAKPKSLISSVTTCGWCLDRGRRACGRGVRARPAALSARTAHLPCISTVQPAWRGGLSASSRSSRRVAGASSEAAASVCVRGPAAERHIGFLIDECCVVVPMVVIVFYWFM